MTDIERFLAHVRKADNGCWEWLGARSNKGYGQFRASKQTLAHRFAYQAFIGPIPPGLCLDHLCRNRACVNPAHLEPVTVQENVLRGEGIAAVNAKKTYCKYGHEFTPANTYPWGGMRYCRACKLKRQKA